MVQRLTCTFVIGRFSSFSTVMWLLIAAISGSWHDFSQETSTDFCCVVFDTGTFTELFDCLKTKSNIMAHFEFQQVFCFHPLKKQAHEINILDEKNASLLKLYQPCFKFRSKKTTASVFMANQSRFCIRCVEQKQQASIIYDQI